MAKIVKEFGERRSEIIKVALELFQNQEYEKTSMQDIVNTLGIAKGTIYHYFKSKEALLEAVIESIVEQNLKEMQGLIEKEKGNALQKLKCLVDVGNRPSQNKNLLDYLHKPGNAILHSRLLATTLVKQATLYASLIAQGCREGIFKTENPLECAEFILAGVQFLTDVGIYPWTQEDIKRRMKAFPQLIEQLLQASSGSFQFLNS